MKASQFFAALIASSAMTMASAQTGADSCVTPDAIAGQGSFAFDQTLATTGVEGQAEFLCYFFGSSTVDNDVWFSWTADATGTAFVGTCTSVVDTKIAVYGSAGCPTAGTALACNDDSCGLQTTVSFPVTTGTAYTLQVGTFPGALGGTGNMDITIAGPATNDDCTTPSAIAGQGSFAFNNSGATTGLEGQSEFLCYFFGASTVDNDVWYSWTADVTGTATISTCTSSVDTKIAIYGSAGCPTAGTALACNDDSCGFQTQIALGVTAGTTYTLQVGTFPGAIGGLGNMDIVINPPAVNDDCTAPTAIAGQGSFAFNQNGATTGLEGQTEFLCYAFGSSTIENDVWYSWTADATGVALIGTCTSTVDTKIAVYPGGGCPTAGTAIACNDDACGLQTTVQAPVTAGTTYMLQVGTFPGAFGGTGNMDINIVPPASNDNCATPITIAGQGSFAFSQIGATTGAEGQAEFLCYYFASSTIDNDIWYTWTADATGTAIVSTCTSTIDTKISVYPGAGCPTTGTSIACADDGCGLQTNLVIPTVTNGTTYTIQVGTFPGAVGGTGNMDIVILPPLTNDDCSTPVAIAGLGTFNYNNSIATTGTEGQLETLCYAFGTSGVFSDIWYSWTSNATGVATVSTCAGGTLDTKIAAYPGGGCPTNGTALACNDDTCGLQSEITFNAVAGTSYMLQIGTFPNAATGSGSFEVSMAGPVEPGTAYCFCDSGNSPCGNPGLAGNGCANGAAAGGANLTGSGAAVVGADSLVLSATGLTPNQPGLYFQGLNAVGGGTGVVFGDGIRCAGGGVVRLGVRVADATGASSTAGLPQAISVKGGVVAGDLRFYQLWYRDPANSPCGALFNLTNGYSIQW